jgi:hypothetical protein
MTAVTVHNPAMCCATGICRAAADPKLGDPAADLDWLQAQGVTLRRLGLGREPAEFAANATIRQIMQDGDGDDLPVFVVDSAMKAKARDPKRAELAEWAGLTDVPMREAIAVGRMGRQASAGPSGGWPTGRSPGQ